MCGDTVEGQFLTHTPNSTVPAYFQLHILTHFDTSTSDRSWILMSINCYQPTLQGNLNHFGLSTTSALNIDPYRQNIDTEHFINPNVKLCYCLLNREGR